MARYFLVRALLGLGLGSSFLYWVVIRDSDRSITNSMVGVFEHGGVGGRVPNEDKDNTASIERQELEKAVCHLIRPETSEEYGIIIGHHGVGKSTLVCKAIRSLESPKGVVYFLTPESVEASFMREFRETLGYRVPILFVPYLRRWFFQQPQPSIDLPSKVDPVQVWDEMRNKLKEVAFRYRQKHGQPAVLVIDGADIIVKQNQPFFSVLQDFAKASADSGDLRVVFVSSDGTAVDFLQSRSAISRAEAPLVIPGVPDDQAVKYLVDKGLKNNQAKSAVQEVTGGSFVKMNDYVREVNKGRTHEEIVRKEQRWIVDELKDLRLDAKLKLFKELVKQGSLPADVVRDLLVEGKVPAEKVNEVRSRLVEKNIIFQLDSEFKLNNRAVYFFFQFKILLMMRMTRLQRRSFWSITMCWEFNPMQHSRFFFRLIFLIFLTYWSTGDKEGQLVKQHHPNKSNEENAGEVFKKIVEAYGVERRKKKRRRMMILRNGKLMRKAKRSSGTVI